MPWDGTERRGAESNQYLTLQEQLNRQDDIPVSYTHLDVYKRQIKGGFNPRTTAWGTVCGGVAYWRKLGLYAVRPSNQRLHH